ncbi:MAG: phytanoyl-CoA dioxygenase family protein, partial [Pseudomonadota bacterium]
MPTQAMPLSPQELTAYQEQGYLIRPGVFSTHEIEHLGAAVEAAVDVADQEVAQGETYFLDGKRFVDTHQCTVQFEHTPESNTVRVIEPVHVLHPSLNALLDDPRLVVPMQQIIGQQDLALWTAKLNLKRPRQGSGFGWHQDSPYWIHDCTHVDLLPNVMLALDAQTQANGCFEVIAGSHQHGMLPGTADGSQLGGFFTDPNAFD